MGAADGGRIAPPVMPLRILIVEDDALTAAAFAAALNDAGHEVVAITDNGSAALGKAERTSADLALIDITLRDGRTGLAAARALHEDHVETVLVSGDINLRAKAESVQALGCMAKPADANQVAQMVSNLARNHAWAPRQSRVPVEDSSK